jgi:DNA processing protein
LHRPVMGVPGPVTAAQSEGVHQLIRRGAASLVTRGDEVLELVGTSGQHLVEAPRGRVLVRDRLAPRQQQVLDAVPVSRTVGADSIARTAGIGLLEVQSTLTSLLRRGLVEVDAHGWRVRNANLADSPDSAPDVPTMSG